MNEELQRIKECIFDKKKHLLCDNRSWCGNKNSYCPYYGCGSLDTLSKFTDRQWENTIKRIRSNYKEITFEDLVDEVLDELRYKRPRGKVNENRNQ